MEAAIQINDEQNLHSMAFSPIHKNIQHILPYLEQRQEAAKRLYEYRNKLTDEQKANYEAIVLWCQAEIEKHLYFMRNKNNPQ